MGARVKWGLILVLALLTISFFIGLSGSMEGYGGIGWGLLGMAVAISVGLILGVAAIVHFRRTKGIKGVFIGILILLVLIPLVAMGTCALSIGGDFVRRLFFK